MALSSISLWFWFAFPEEWGMLSTFSCVFVHLENFLIKSFAYVRDQAAFLLLSCKSSLCFLDMHSLLNLTWICFLLFHELPFNSDHCVLWYIKVLTFMKSDTFFSFIVCTFNIISKKTPLNPMIWHFFFQEFHSLRSYIWLFDSFLN
jgi:hypothetical protein